MSRARHVLALGIRCFAWSGVLVGVVAKGVLAQESNKHIDVDEVAATDAKQEPIVTPIDVADSHWHDGTFGTAYTTALVVISLGAPNQLLPNFSTVILLAWNSSGYRLFVISDVRAATPKCRVRYVGLNATARQSG
jgi:hypothetical protein